MVNHSDLGLMILHLVLMEESKKTQFFKRKADECYDQLLTRVTIDHLNELQKIKTELLKQN